MTEEKLEQMDEAWNKFQRQYKRTHGEYASLGTVMAFFGWSEEDADAWADYRADHECG